MADKPVNPVVVPVVKPVVVDPVVVVKPVIVVTPAPPATRTACEACMDTQRALIASIDQSRLAAITLLDQLIQLHNRLPQ